ncbi:MFS general substrate transporter, partial [Ramicandelaber brevisporus]
MLDATAVSPALPAIAQSLNVPLNGQIVWTYCGFLLTSCVFQPILGTISEIPSVGVKYTLLFTMSCFTIGTIMSGAAESLPVMVIGRVVQGIGAAGMFSKAMYMVVRLTNLRNAVVAMSWMGVPYIVGSVMGPVVGGVICKGAGSWRWTFYAAVPIAMVVLTMVIMFVWSPTKQSATAWSDVDFVGGILIFTALTLLSLGLLWAGSSFSWTHPYTLACLALSGCSFVGFAVYEAFGAKSPMFHQRKLLLHRNLFVSCILNIFLGAGLFCTLMYTPVYYQTNRADNAADSGMRLSPMLISAAIGSCVNSLIVAKFNIYRIPVVIAYAMLMVGHGLMVLWDVTGQQSADFEMSALIILGLGYGIATGGTIVSGIVGLHPSDICPSLAVLSFCRSLGGILGIVTSTATIVNTVIGKLGSLSPPETA